MIPPGVGAASPVDTMSPRATIARMTVYPVTTAQAATILGCTARTVQRHVAAAGLGRRLGNATVLEASEIAKLRRLVQATPGNPGKTPKRVIVVDGDN